MADMTHNDVSKKSKVHVTAHYQDLHPVIDSSKIRKLYSSHLEVDSRQYYMSLVDNILSLLQLPNITFPSMAVKFFGSQIGGETQAPLSYTGSPWKLFTSDVLLFLRWSPYLINIVLPLWPYPSHSLDELYPSLGNIIDIILHSILFVMQAVFLISLPFLSTVSFILYVAYIGGFLALNTAVCKLLNGKIPEEGLKSTEDDQSKAWERHDDESWIFLNGVAVGYVSIGVFHVHSISLRPSQETLAAKQH
jgi:hypothetical protein